MKILDIVLTCLGPSVRYWDMSPSVTGLENLSTSLSVNQSEVWTIINKCLFTIMKLNLCYGPVGDSAIPSNTVEVEVAIQIILHPPDNV